MQGSGVLRVTCPGFEGVDRVFVLAPDFSDVGCDFVDFEVFPSGVFADESRVETCFAAISVDGQVIVFAFLWASASGREAVEAVFEKLGAGLGVAVD